MSSLPVSHRDHARLLPRPADRWATLALVVAAFVVVPRLATDYWFSAILVPFLILSLAAVGLQIVTGYAGQLSLGTAAFMAVGAFATYNLELRVPGLPLLASLALGGLIAAGFGVVIGLPSLRIKGFYVLVSTLFAQFFVEWALTKFGWFSNHDASGVISAPPLVIAGLDFGSPAGRYQLTLAIVVVLTVAAARLVHGDPGRRWVAVRDLDTAAAVIGIPLGRTKLLAFAVGAFYAGIAGALWAFVYLGTVEPHGFDLTRSFQILFIVILGGLGSLTGAFVGAAFIVLLPLALDHAAGALFGGAVDPSNLQHAQKIVFGVLIIVFLVKEPDGLVRLWRDGRARLRRWPLDT